MDFSKHSFPSRQSIVDEAKGFNQSTIDYETHKLREKLKDPSLGTGFVSDVLHKLGEAEIRSISNYALRKGTHPGKLFVRICNNTMVKKGLK